MIYCLVPEALAGELLEPLRKHYAEHAGVEVIVDRRRRDERRLHPNGRLTDRFAELDRRMPKNRRRPVLPRRLERELPPAMAAHAGELRWEHRLAALRPELADAGLVELLELNAGGDEGALSEVYWRYLPRVRSRLRRLLGDHREAEDATRYVFGRAFDGLEDRGPGRRSFEAFLDDHADAVAREMTRLDG